MWHVCVHATITSEPPKFNIEPQKPAWKNDFPSFRHGRHGLLLLLCHGQPRKSNRQRQFSGGFDTLTAAWTRDLGQGTLSSTLKWIVPPMVEEGWLVMLISGQWIYNYCQWWQSLQGWRVATVRPYNMAQWTAQILQLSPLMKYGTVLLIKCHQAGPQHLFVVAKFS